MHELCPLTIEDTPDPADLAVLEERVAAAAVAAAGVGPHQEFGVFVRDAERRVLAGVAATVWGGCCDVQALWVEESLRGRGLARALMAEAESEARRRGCTLAVGLAHDLLARDLYERIGYETAGLIQGYPAGSATRWYYKRL